MTRNSVKRYSALVDASSAMGGGGVPSIFDKGIIRSVSAIEPIQISRSLKGPVKNANSTSAIMNGSVKLISLVFMAQAAASTDIAKNRHDRQPQSTSLALMYAVIDRR